VGTGPSPWAFAFANDNTVYIADDLSPSAASGPKGGVQKWTNSGLGWTLAATFNTGTFGTRGVTVIAGGNTVTVLATTADSDGTNDGVSNKVLKFIDDGSPSPTATTLVTAPSNTFFRGLALPPQ
jgi:hypothetical protein